MHRQEHHMLRCSQPQHPRSQQRSTTQVEGLLSFCLCHPPGFSLALNLFHLAQINQRQAKVDTWCNHLYRMSFNFGKAGPQHFMPPHDLGERSLQRGHVEFSFQSQRRSHVVEGTVWFQLVQKPQPLLGKRQRQLSISPHCYQRWRLHAPCYLQLLLDDPSQSSHRRILEQTAQMNFYVEHLPHSRHDLRRQQRVPAHLEEVLINFHTLHLQQLAPDSRYDLFIWRARLHPTLQLTDASLRLWQRLVIYLPIRCQR